MTKTRDYVTEVDEQSIVLIKDTRDMKEDEELQTLARMIVDNMHTEAMVKVRVGYGNRVHNLQDIAKSYQEAKMALDVGKKSEEFFMQSVRRLHTACLELGV